MAGNSKSLLFYKLLMRVNNVALTARVEAEEFSQNITKDFLGD